GDGLGARLANGRGGRLGLILAFEIAERHRRATLRQLEANGPADVARAARHHRQLVRQVDHVRAVYLKCARPQSSSLAPAMDLQGKRMLAAFPSRAREEAVARLAGWAPLPH